MDFTKPEDENTIPWRELLLAVFAFLPLVAGVGTGGKELPFLQSIVLTLPAILLSLKNPVLLVATVIVTHALQYFTAGLFDPTFAYEATAGLMILNVIRMRLKSERPDLTLPLIFGTTVFAGLLIADARASLPFNLYRTVSLSLFALVPFQITTDRDKNLLLWVLSGCSLLVALWVWREGYGYFRNHNEAWSEWTDPNYPAHFIALGILSTVAIFVKTKSNFLVHGLLLLVLAFLFFAMLIPVSRGSIVTLFIGSAAFFGFRYRFSWKLLAGIAALGFLTYGFFLLPSGQHLLTRFQNSDLASGNGRTVLQAALVSVGLRADTADLIFGHGSGSSGYAIGSLVGDYTLGSHNGFLELWFEQGLVAVIAFIALIITTIVRMFRAKSSVYAPQFGILVFLIAMGFELAAFHLPFVAAAMGLACSISLPIGDKEGIDPEEEEESDGYELELARPSLSLQGGSTP